MDMVRRLGLWAQLIKFQHSVFALPFALMAAFLASPGWPGAGKLALIVLCMVLARNVAMTYNRIVDARLDAANPRTADRPIPKGQIGTASAWVFLTISAGGFVLACSLFYLWFDNPWPMIFAGPVLAYLCAYSWTKRFTSLSHLWLGLALGLSPVGAWIAIQPATVGYAVALLCVAVTCWTAGFDMIYACQDVEFDRQMGLYSVPARLGIAKALWLARTAHAVVICSLLALGWLSELGWLYYAALLVVAGLLLVEHCLVRPTDLKRINVAFFTINGAVSLILAIATIADILL